MIPSSRDLDRAGTSDRWMQAMTVIAAYGGHGSTFLFADTLITSDTPALTGDVTLPISSQEIPASVPLDANGKVHLYSYYKKVTKVNDNLVLTYAGNVDLASSIISRIKDNLENFDGNHYMNALNKIQEIVNPFRSYFGQSIAILGLIVCIDNAEYRVCPFGIGFSKEGFDNPLFPEPLFIAGSGAGIMRENIASVLTSQHLSLLDGGEVPAMHVPLTAALTAIGLQHYRELTGDAGLDNAFGGPFEIALVDFKDNGLPCLKLLDEISFSYWIIEKKSDNEVLFGPMGPIIFQKYLHGALISATLIIEKQDIDPKSRAIKVESTKSVISRITMKESEACINLIELFSKQPIFRPSTHVMYFVDRSIEGKMHMGLHFDNESFFVEYAEKGFKMMLKPRILEPFREWYSKISL